MYVKKCYQCEEFKPLEEFHRRNSTRDGRQAICKSCRKSPYNIRGFNQHCVPKDDINDIQYRLDAMRRAKTVWYRQGGVHCVPNKLFAKALVGQEGTEL